MQYRWSLNISKNKKVQRQFLGKYRKLSYNMNKWEEVRIRSTYQLSWWRICHLIFRLSIRNKTLIMRWKMLVFIKFIAFCIIEIYIFKDILKWQSFTYPAYQFHGISFVIYFWLKLMKQYVWFVIYAMISNHYDYSEHNM